MTDDKPTLATGGLVTPGRIVRVGEDTPPLVVPRINPQDRAQIQADAERILTDFGKALQAAMEPVRREFVRLSERYPKPCDICGTNLAGRTREQRQAHRQDHHWIRRAWHWWVTAWTGFWKDFH